MTNLTKLFEAFKHNMRGEMYTFLSKQLGVSVDVIQELGVGFYPAKQVFVFAEREAGGKICGLVYRTLNGGKYMREGSKRGLTFAPTERVDTPASENVRWVRCSPTTGITCPICGRSKYCMVSSENTHDPQAVLCTKIEKGSDPNWHSDKAEMYLHILKDGGRTGSLSLLPPSDFPVLVVEGQTDVLAAMDMGFTAVGKPSALGGGRMLQTLLTGRHVLVLGERDGGAGVKGMKSTTKSLEKTTKSVGGSLPPEGVKDLRNWRRVAHITRDGLLAYVAEHQEKRDDTKAKTQFENDNPSIFAVEWIKHSFMKDNKRIIQRQNLDWCEWDGVRYRATQEEYITNAMYEFAVQCTLQIVTARKSEEIQYPLTAHRARNVLQATQSLCSVRREAPCWLSGEGKGIDPLNILAFRNGLLDISTWRWYPPTPNFFTYNGMDFDYEPEADYSAWVALVEDILDDDEDSIRLLQQWFGYNLIPDTSQEKMMIFIGRPRSGKGTLQHGLETILGPEQVAGMHLKQLSESFGLAPLMGKLACMIGDAVSAGRSTSEALTKLLSIVGQDAQPINRKGKPILPNVRLRCRFTLAMNLALQLGDAANALTPRLNVIEFPKTYVGKEDRTLKHKISKMGPAITTWALIGLDDLRTEGKFIEPDRSKTRILDMADGNSPIKEFVNHECKRGEEEGMSVDEFVGIYRCWAKYNGHRPGNSNSIIDQVLSVCCDVHKVYVPQADTKIKWFTGIGLTDHAKENFSD